jgi:SAM-dependent methyltransferase
MPTPKSSQGDRLPNWSHEFPADLYHAHHQGYDEDIAFWISLAETKELDVLEIGCGTCRVLSRFNPGSVDVVGLDLDFSRLVFASRLFGRNKPVLFQSDAENFHLSRCFDLVIMPCNTYSTLPSNTRLHVLNNVKCHLKPDGVFAASIPNPFLLEYLQEEDSHEQEVEVVFNHPQDGNPVQVSSSMNIHTNQLHITWFYDHLFPDGRVERHVVQVIHFLDTMDVYKNEILRAGLKLKNQFGDFNRSAFDSQSTNWIFLLEHA